MATASVALTGEEIDHLIDAMDDEVRHWEMCGGTDEENARYQRIITVYLRIARKLEAARDTLEDN